MARPRYTREVSSSTGFKSDFKTKRALLLGISLSRSTQRLWARPCSRKANASFPHQGMSSWVLQRDNDPAHFKAAKIIADCNKGEMGSRIELLPDWPRNSPDLSLIETCEHMWMLRWQRRDVEPWKSSELQ